MAKRQKAGRSGIIYIVLNQALYRTHLNIRKLTFKLPNCVYLSLDKINPKLFTEALDAFLFVRDIFEPLEVAYSLTYISKYVT